MRAACTKAAKTLDRSQSAVSHAVARLEKIMGVRLLTRTTRSVSPTHAGQHLVATAGPRREEVQAEMSALSAMSDKPAGTIHITTSDHAARTLLLPKLAPLLQAYPDIRVEIVVDYGLTDIVTERFDAGIRLGEQVARGMIAVPIGPHVRASTVGTPSYFARYARPRAARGQTPVHQLCHGTHRDHMVGRAVGIMGPLVTSGAAARRFRYLPNATCELVSDPHHVPLTP